MSPPSSIAHYRITTKLGEGGMGAVYRATDTKLNREVAIKILPDAFASDPERMARFTREAQVLASLNHPNIAAIYGVEARALVMELVEGATLAEKIPLSAAEALPLVHHLIDALEYAHERGVIHRDLKPANIKVTGPASGSPGTLKLLDFGIAKIMDGAPRGSGDPSESPTITIADSLPGRIMGTARYMSPEQARGGKVDHRTDVWSFGAVLFEVLTGRPVFPGATVSDTLAAVLRADPEFSAVPAPFRKLVERCLQRDLKQRLGWIGDARFLLEAPNAESSSRVPKPGVIAILTVAVALAGFVVSRWLPSRGAGGRAPAARIVRVASDSVGFFPAISPDGKLVAYLARRAKSYTVDLWVQQVSGGAAIRVTDGGLPPRIFSSPVFAADGAKLFYYSDVNAPGIYEVPALGGESRLAIPGAGIYRVCPSPDGKWLAYVQEGKLMVRPPTGGDARDIAPGTKVLPLFLAWSPDNSSILAAIANSERKPVDLVVVSLDGSRPRPAPGLFGNLERRGFGDLNIMRLIAWLPGDDIVFNARYGDAINLWCIPLADMGDGQPYAVTLAPWNNGGADIRGTHLVFANERATNQVWTLPADLNRGKVLGELALVTPELQEAQFPDVREDGSAMTYISRNAGGQGVSVLDLKTGKERSLVLGQQNAAYSTFSPDGSQIAFGTGGRGWPAFLVPAAGGDVKRVGDSGGRIRGWSRDGRYLLIWRVPQGRNTIGVLDLTTGRAAETLRSDAGGLAGPRLSPDSRWVAFHSPDAPGSPVWVAPFRGDVAVPDAEWIMISERAGSPFWAPDGRSLYFARMQDGSPYATRLFRQPIDPVSGRPAGPAAEFYRLDGYSFSLPLLNTISATRDHVYMLLGGARSDIWTMELPN